MKNIKPGDRISFIELSKGLNNQKLSFLSNIGHLIKHDGKFFKILLDNGNEWGFTHLQTWIPVKVVEIK